MKTDISTDKNTNQTTEKEPAIVILESLKKGHKEYVDALNSLKAPQLQTVKDLGSSIDVFYSQRIGELRVLISQYQQEGEVGRLKKASAWRYFQLHLVEFKTNTRQLCISELEEILQ